MLLKPELQVSKLVNKKEITELQTMIMNIPSVEEMLQEGAERERRKSNIMIYNAPEVLNTDEQTRNGKDFALIERITREAGCSLRSPDDIKLVRIGKAVVGKSRPLKVTLSSEQDALLILKKSKAILEKDNFRGLFISSDKTKKQRDDYRNLKIELNRRLQLGEVNLRIKYSRGVPAIVQEN